MSSDRFLRILYLVEASGGGVGKHIIDLATGISKAGHHVTLAYSDLRPDTMIPYVMDTLVNVGVKLTSLPMKTLPHPVMDVQGILALRRLIDSYRFHVVHCHSSKAGFLGRTAVAMSRTHPTVIYTPHVMSYRAYPMTQYVERALSSLCQAIIAVSPSEQRDIIKHRIAPPSKVRMILNGVDVFDISPSADKDHIRARWGIGASVLVIGAAGRLCTQKDPVTFFRAAAYLLAEHSDLVFIWVGDGPLRSTIQELILRYGIADGVRLTGLRRDVYNIMQIFDVFVSSSLYESFGYTTCEAMALLKPVVVTNVMGTCDIVVNEQTGLVVPTRDPIAMARAIERLSAHPELRVTLGKAGRILVEQKLDLTSMIKQTENLYRSLVH